MSTLPVAPPQGTQSIVTNHHTLLLDAFIPGFSLISSALQIDVSSYIPVLLFLGVVIFAFQYVDNYFWTILEAHFICSAEVKESDEAYNFLMTWIADQKFAKSSRRFVASASLISHNWDRYDYDTDEDEDDDELFGDSGRKKRDKKLNFTPSTGKHYFFYRRRLCFFTRAVNDSRSFLKTGDSKEDISISCFGRNTSVLKALLEECRANFLKHDENKTIIYRGSIRHFEPYWTRCMSRISRPFSTVVLDEEVKAALLEDMSDYLHASTRRWYSNRGIPYRRGYLLYGPPGTGKSSLSFAIAGYFKLKIYILSLNSLAMNEENISSLFAQLPKQCVVLLEDIDTAGLTHTRRDTESVMGPEDLAQNEATRGDAAPSQSDSQPPQVDTGRISLSALLNVIDGVASQEGRILIMTTNHVESLDPALVRPGRVDMKVRFNLADTYMVATVFKSIFIPTPADLQPRTGRSLLTTETSSDSDPQDTDEKAVQARLVRKRLEEEARILDLSTRFAELLPEGVYSPAEIQGYLLKHKNDPDGAVDGAKDWVREMEDRRREKNTKEKRDKETSRQQEVVLNGTYDVEAGKLHEKVVVMTDGVNGHEDGEVA